MKQKSLDRRTFLRGIGATMALPFLEIMRPSGALAKTAVAKPPVRTAFFYIPNGVVQSAWHPKDIGQGFKLSPTLQPLESVREKVAVFTKLDRIKVAGTDGHAQAGACWLSSAAPDELSPAGYPLKRTIDQIIATEAGKHTAFRSLELSCNPYEDNRESVYFDNISWYGHGHVARSLRDPRAVFDRLFAMHEHASSGSVLDVVLDDAKSLNRELGYLDQQKLGEYMDSVRTVERQIERVKERQASIDALRLQPPTKPWQAMSREEFIQVMGDLMILALQTDLTRVATLMSGPERWSTPLTVEGLFEKPVQHHGMTHAQGKEEVRKDLEQLDRFHIEQFATLVSKMDAIKEGEGTMLDNMIFTLGSGLSSGELHIYTDLPTVVAGSGGGAIATDRHVKSPQGTPIANLWLTMAQTMGVDIDRIADSTGPLAVA
ncbi:MAG: DUF1552 domain-containing protein [Verrucomicrobiales bacterium]|nr:DUF1552 domain-containing protein [Verrucomicrobiales bacterium]MDF1785380.1 DUF1552 domain-containing protein [Verrucomicrobiales bacterium]